MHTILISLSKRFSCVFRNENVRVNEGGTKSVHNRCISAVVAELVLVISGIIVALTVAGAARLKVENSFIDYFKKGTEIYRGMKFIDDELGGTTPLDVTLDFPSQEEPAQAPGPTDPDDDDDPDFDFDFEDDDDEDDPETYWFTTTKFEEIAKVHDYLDALAATGKVISPATLWKLGTILNGKPFETFEISILLRSVSDDVKEVLIKPYASVEENQVRISVRIKDSMEGLRRDELVKKIQKDLKNLVSKTTQFRASYDDGICRGRRASVDRPRGRAGH